MRTRQRWALLVILLIISYAAQSMGSHGAVEAAVRQPYTNGAALYQALLRTPFSDSELPAPFTSPQISAFHSNQASTDFLGSVRVDLSGPDAVTNFFYDVFDSAASAADSFQHTPSLPTYTPPGFVYPIYCANNPLSDGGWTLCLRTYPVRPAWWKAMKAQARWTMAV